MINIVGDCEHASFWMLMKCPPFVTCPTSEKSLFTVEESF